MAVQVPPTLVRMATPSGVALVRLVNNSTSVLPVTTAMALPPQLNGRVAGTASIPPACKENVHRKRASKTCIENVHRKKGVAMEIMGASATRWQQRGPFAPRPVDGWPAGRPTGTA